MHHFVRYDKGTGRIMGSFEVSNAELLPLPLSPNEAFVEVKDEEHLKVLDAATPRSHLLEGSVTDGEIRSLKQRPRYRGRIVLTTDAEDRDGDGLPELAADGRSSVTITARLVDAHGKALNVDVPITFKTSRGSLSSRQAAPKKGAATIELASAGETTSARITAAAPEFEPGELNIEFIPVEEYKTLHRKGGAER
jgi:hypothetical protein